MNIFEKLAFGQKSKKTSLCVGLDPNPQRFPPGFDDGPQGIYRFLSEIIQATAPYACAFKPQIAYFSAFWGEDVLEQLIRDIHRDHPEIPVILDAKRGDIGATAEMYAREAYERYGADGVTVNPYMGADTVKPFTSYKDKGVFLLCRTSNPGAIETQNVGLADGLKYYEFLGSLAERSWNSNKNVGLVVGATAIDELAILRKACPNLWFLVPGVGAQGGSLENVLDHGQFPGGMGVLVNSSRGILYASEGEDFAQAAEQSARDLQKKMEVYL